MQEPQSRALGGDVQTVRLSRVLETTYDTASLRVRPFGINERDLEVDFGKSSRPALVTDIIECCATTAGGRTPDRNLIWELQVSTRIESLLRIVALGGGFDSPLPRRCLNESCGATVEVDLSLHDLIEGPGEQSDFISVDCGPQILELRKPNGLDQLRWTAREFENEQMALEAMVQTLVRSDSTAADLTLDDQSMSAIDRAMQENDSLVSFNFEVVCPYCDHSSEIELDLQEFAIEYLKRSQRRLLSMIHRLAKHYHWSEQQSFAVPHWRRVHYLRLLEEERK